MSCLKHSCLPAADHWKGKGENGIVSSQGILCSGQWALIVLLGLAVYACSHSFLQGIHRFLSSWASFEFTKVQRVCLGELEVIMQVL